MTAVHQAIGNADGAWPFEPDAERAYLEQRYTDELRDEAGKQALDVFVVDDRIVAPPSNVSVLTGERAVRINRRQTSAIRPKTAGIKVLQSKPPQFNTQQFLEALDRVYIDVADRETWPSETGPKRRGHSIETAIQPD